MLAGGERGHVEGASDVGPSAADGALPSQCSAVMVERRDTDEGGDAAGTAMAARIAAVDAAVLAADEGIQIHGGFGYTVEYHVERHYRDAKTIEVLDGGNDALKDRLAGLQFAG